VQLERIVSPMLEEFFEYRKENRLTLEDFRKVLFHLVSDGTLEEKLLNRRIELVSTPLSKRIEFQRICVPIRDIRYSESNEQINIRDVDIE
jgi:hypothetical protein